MFDNNDDNLNLNFPNITHTFRSPFERNRFNILYQNIRSLPKNLKNVEAQIKAETNKNIITHIIALTETWLNPIKAGSCIMINYTPIHSFRPVGRGGGCSFYIHDSLKFDQ